MSFFVKSIIVFIIALIVVIVLYILKKMKDEKEKIRWYSSREYKLIHILVPKNNEKDPVSAEQMFASLHGIFRPEEKLQEQLSFEIVSRGKYIHFYAYVPTDLKDFVEGQIYAQYPNVEINQVEDYTTEKKNNQNFAGAELILNKPDVYPIKTFMNFKVDPLAAITSVLAKTFNDEEIWIQLIIKPVSDSWQDKGLSYIESIKSGTAFEGDIGGQVVKKGVSFLSDVVKTAAGRGLSEAETAEAKLSGPQAQALKNIESKITKLGFTSKIRILCFAENKNSARAKVNMVAGAFKQFNMINMNGFELGPISHEKTFYNLYEKRIFYDEGLILNIEELASLYHLPNVTVETPNIVWAGSKKGEPPANLPLEGRINNKDLVVFAKSDFRNIISKFGIKNIDRRLHMYAIGKTGTGKSTMLENMINDDIKNGRGVAVVDPHGELINHIIDFIPEERLKDIIYFNPADKDWPIGFNPLESVDPDLKNIVASGVVGIFKKIFGESWGPRLEYILRNAILALLEYPESTLLGVMRLLVDKDFRDKVLEKVKDPVVRDFFLNEYNRWQEKFRLEAIQSIQNKVGQFLSSSNIRNIVGQPKSTFDIREAMDSGKILLIDLSIGKIGEDNAALLGSLLITKIQLSAMQRVNIPESQRRDFYLYVDEFQNFATDSFAVILSEARKYHLNLIMTHQYIAQMPETVSKAVFGNVGTIISFRLGSSDASQIAKEFEPVFEANDLVNLDNYHIYVKMAIDGVTRPAFSAITLPPTAEKNNFRDKIIELSRERYSKPRAFVEEKIQKWSEDDKKNPIEKEMQFKKDKLDEIINNEKQGSEYKKNNITYTKFKDTKNFYWYIPFKKEDLNNNIEKPENNLLDQKNNKILGKTKNIENINLEKNNNYKFKPFLKPILERNNDLTNKNNNLTETNLNSENNFDILVTGNEIEDILNKNTNKKDNNDNVDYLNSGDYIDL